MNDGTGLRISRLIAMRTGELWLFAKIIVVDGVYSRLKPPFVL
jgi:hypothetical protein